MPRTNMPHRFCYFVFVKRDDLWVVRHYGFKRADAEKVSIDAAREGLSVRNMRFIRDDAHRERAVRRMRRGN